MNVNPATKKFINEPLRLEEAAITQNYNKTLEFLDFIAGQTETVSSNKHVWVQLVLSTDNGHVVRSDFLVVRLAGCTLVDRTQSFTIPQQKTRSAAHLNGTDFATLLDYSVGAVVASQDLQGTVQYVSKTLQGELSQRLSLPWTLPSPMTRKKLALVGSRHEFVLQPWLKAARSIGIILTIFGANGSWLQKSDSAGVVDSYVPVDMTADCTLTSRIVTAIRTSGRIFDGVTTFTDTLLYTVACVARILHLSTSPPTSFAKAIDKHAARIEFGSDDCQVLRVKGLDNLKHMLRTRKEPLQYPLIVKPCRGWNSEGVTKVNGERELFTAVSKLDTGPRGVDALIETYVDGPEIDANFILYDGEDLFCEINDGFPCTADNDASDESANFMETDMLYPTKLNADESSMIRKSLHGKLLAIGFRTGVFHVEGRIRSSASHYSIEDGLLDLRPKSSPPKEKASIFLLEVNARPPGIGALTATALVYGVDFAAVHMLCALGEPEMVKALSQPFALSVSSSGGGAQHWADLLSIPAQSDGVYDGDDACEELSNRRPDLHPNITWSMCCLQKGDYVPGPPFMVKVAYFLVVSQKSRQDVLRVATEIKEAVRVPLDVGGVSAQGPFAAVGAAILAKKSSGQEEVLGERR